MNREMLPVHYKGTHYSDIWELSGETAKAWIAHHGEIFRIGGKLYGGDLRSIKLLGKEMGLCGITRLTTILP